jgi:predicted O-methyltransferase YrrM
MTEAELLWLAEQASRRWLIAEIGSFHGRSTRALADNCIGTVIAVDPWYSGREKDAEIGRSFGIAPEPPFPAFLRNMADSPCTVIPYRLDSLKAAQNLRNLRFDMVFIDGDHEYESVKEDILAWRPLLREGGLLCGHDYGHPDYHAGVTAVVNELFGQPSRGPDLIWWI